MKKFINVPENVAEEMVQGICVLRPDLRRLSGYKVLLRSDVDAVRKTQVAIVSGGGSGHEPAHAGYIGPGMLTAAVLGDVFTSPDTDSIFAAIKAVAGPSGVLLIVKNYTGDRLNFGLAAEMAKSEGIPVEMIVVHDDVAINTAQSTTGARGLAGTVLIHKLAGAAAAAGKTLSEVAAIGRDAIGSLATMGVSFSAGTSPAVGKPSFELGDNEMELGLGIHGEPGVCRTRIQPADQLTETLLDAILQHRPGQQKRVAVMINNLGATTEMELAIVARRVLSFLRERDLVVERLYAGTYLSSLDMAGLSLSVLGVNDHWLQWLDAVTAAPAWVNAFNQQPGRPDALEASPNLNFRAVASSEPHSDLGRIMKRAIEAACDALIRGEGALTEMDRIVGDGDLGASVKRAGIATKKAIDSYPLDDIPLTFKALSHTLSHELGGSSGPLYGVFFLRLGSSLSPSGLSDIDHWAGALQQASAAITELGGAKPGDRTMLDALGGFVQELKRSSADGPRERLLSAVAAARRGADATADMAPRFGRSTYLRDRVLGHPDPGAEAVALWISAAVSAVLQD